jgi:hypothetical protein
MLATTTVAKKPEIIEMIAIMRNEVIPERPNDKVDQIVQMFFTIQVGSHHRIGERAPMARLVYHGGKDASMACLLASMVLRFLSTVRG